MLHCVAVGDPLPTVQWDRNNKVNSFDQQRFKVDSYSTRTLRTPKCPKCQQGHLGHLHIDFILLYIFL